MRKNKRTVKALLVELEKTGIASNACSKVGIARSSYYRWYYDDIEFRMAADKAIESGRANMVDFAESKLIQNMNESNQRALEFYLKHNDSRYRTYYGRELQEYKDILDHQNKVNFGALDAVPRMLLDSIPIDKLVELISPDQEDTPEIEKMPIETLERELAMRYLASILERSKKST